MLHHNTHCTGCPWRITLTYLCALLFFWLYPLQIQAQSGYRFRHLTTKDGLATNTVWTILQDRTGFIWIGTNDGLYRYDGDQLTTIRRNFPEGRGRGNSVTCLAEDGREAMLWVGTDEGLFVWDTACDTLIQPQWDAETKTLLSGRINALLSDSTGQLSVAVNGRGVYRLQPDDTAPQLEFDQPDVQQLRTDDAGNLWLTTYSHGVIRHTPHSVPQTYFGQVPAILSALQTDDGTLWAGTYDGLYRLSADNDMPHKVELRHVEASSRLTVNDIIPYTDGRLCLATSDGLYIYSPDTGEAIQLKTDKHIDGALNSDYLNSLYIDREQTLWIASYFGGVNFLPAGNRNFLNYDFLNYRMPGRVVSAFAEDTQGRLWIGTEDCGLTCYIPATGEVYNFNPKEGPQTVPNYHNIHALLSADDRLYIGMSSGGMDILHLSTGQAEHLSTADGLQSNTIYSFCADRRGNVWIGTTRGLNRYRPDTRQLTAENDVPVQRINCMAEDARGNLWICGEDLGIYCKDADSGRWSDFRTGTGHSLPHTVYTLACVNQTLYIGTQDCGVYRYETDRDELVQLPLAGLDDQIVYRIVPDRYDLWISTGKGLLRYNIQDRTSVLYTTDHGLKSEEMNLNAGIRRHDGTLLFGSVSGLNGFHPDELVFNPHAPAVVLTRLYLNNTPTDVQTPGTPLSQSIQHTRRLVLDSRTISVSFRFAALSYTGSAHNRYRYRLAPFDREWIYTGADMPMASYTNLPAGNYEFCVTACNSDGVWNETGCHLSLTILPPWWATWYMKTLYAALFVLTLCALVLHLHRKHRKQLELLEARKSKELYDSKMEFFTHLIHEIRTPLTLILSPVDQLIKRSDSLPFHNELRMIRRNSHRLLELVNRMMDFRKLEAQAFNLNPTAIDLRGLLGQLCSDFVPATTAKSIVLHTSWPENGTCQVRADREALTKIIVNLLSNALKFTRTFIDVSLERDDANSCWLLAIQDDGPGIPEKELQLIFEPFYQVRTQMPSDYIGTGIGLSLVRDLTERSGGRVTVESEPGKGSTFRISLPVYEASSIPSAGQPCTSQTTVVVVEDNDDMRRFLVSILQTDYSVRDYPDARSAYEALGQCPADLVISDIMMPGMDGYAFCRTLKNDLSTSHIPVVLLTAKMTDTDRIEGLGNGADAYLTKPFSPEVLKAQLNSLLENRERIFRRFREEPSGRLVAPSHTGPDTDFVRRMDDIILHHLSDSNFSVATMLQEIGMSRTAFFIKIKAVSGMTFSDYVRIMRLKRAVELFNEGQSYIGDVAYKTGFSSPSYFCNCFKKQFGLSPTEYLRKQGIAVRSRDL